AARGQRTVNDLLHRTDIENRQIGIDCLYRTTYLRLQAGGGERGPDRHAFRERPGAWKLVDRSVNVGSSGSVEAITIDVLDHADPGSPRCVGWARSAPHAQTAAHGIAVRPVGTRCAFIDDCHRLFAGIVVFRE